MSLSRALRLARGLAKTLPPGVVTGVGATTATGVEGTGGGVAVTGAATSAAAEV